MTDDQEENSGMIMTKRLTLLPLEMEELLLLLQSVDELEKHLKLVPSGEILDESTQKAFQWLYNKGVEDKENYLWYTNWQMILTSTNQSVGSIGFIGPPDEDLEVEVGYGTYEKHQNQGYMSEALQAMIKWAFEQPEVKRVVAETTSKNKASQKVLKKSGMKKIKETRRSTFWKIEK